MHPQPHPAVASWTSPPWAITRTIEEDSVEHRRNLGEVCPVEDPQHLCVEVVQRDEVNIATSPVSIRRTPPVISLAGIRMSRDEARTLTQLLTEALTTIENEE
jgi:hypothetical protein